MYTYIGTSLYVYMYTYIYMYIHTLFHIVISSLFLEPSVAKLAMVMKTGFSTDLQGTERDPRWWNRSAYDELRMISRGMFKAPRNSTIKTE